MMREEIDQLRAKRDSELSAKQRVKDEKIQEL
jgi:hypothetical protein